MAGFHTLPPLEDHEFASVLRGSQFNFFVGSAFCLLLRSSRDVRTARVIIHVEHQTICWEKVLDGAIPNSPRWQCYEVKQPSLVETVRLRQGLETRVFRPVFLNNSCHRRDLR